MKVCVGLKEYEKKNQGRKDKMADLFHLTLMEDKIMSRLLYYIVDPFDLLKLIKIGSAHFSVAVIKNVDIIDYRKCRHVERMLKSLANNNVNSETFSVDIHSNYFNIWETEILRKFSFHAKVLYWPMHDILYDYVYKSPLCPSVYNSCGNKYSPLILKFRKINIIEDNSNDSHNYHCVSTSDSSTNAPNIFGKKRRHYRMCSENRPIRALKSILSCLPKGGNVEIKLPVNILRMYVKYMSKISINDHAEAFTKLESIDISSTISSKDDLDILFCGGGNNMSLRLCLKKLSIKIYAAKSRNVSIDRFQFPMLERLNIDNVCARLKKSRKHIPYIDLDCASMPRLLDVKLRGLRLSNTLNLNRGLEKMVIQNSIFFNNKSYDFNKSYNIREICSTYIHLTCLKIFDNNVVFNNQLSLDDHINVINDNAITKITRIGFELMPNTCKSFFDFLLNTCSESVIEKLVLYMPVNDLEHFMSSSSIKSENLPNNKKVWRNLTHLKLIDTSCESITVDSSLSSKGSGSTLSNNGLFTNTESYDCYNIKNNVLNQSILSCIPPHLFHFTTNMSICPSDFKFIPRRICRWTSELQMTSHSSLSSNKRSHDIGNMKVSDINAGKIITFCKHCPSLPTNAYEFDFGTKIFDVMNIVPELTSFDIIACSSPFLKYGRFMMYVASEINMFIILKDMNATFTVKSNVKYNIHSQSNV